MWLKARKSLSLLAIMSILMTLLAACGPGGGTQATATAPAGGTDVNATATLGTDAAATVPTGGGDATPAGGGDATPAGGGDATPAGGGDATPAGGGDATPAAGGGGQLPEGCSNVELAYWNPFTGPDGPFMQQMVDDFNGANPNIAVTMNTVPGGEYIQQLATSAASETLPDIAIMWVDQVPTVAFRNIFRPIPDSVLDAVGVGEGDFPTEVWERGVVAGERYSIPLDMHPMTMFYNQDLLTAAGLDGPPTNREEFEAAAAAMTKDGNNGFMLTTGFPISQIFAMLLYQNGGTWFNEEGTEATWNSEAGVEALTWMRDAQTKYGQANLEVDAELNAFKSGTVGMIWNGIWQTANVTGENVEFASGATAVPQLFDNPGVWAGSHQFGLPNKEADECRDAAIGMFISYMLQNSLTWARAGQIPALNEVRESLAGEGVEPQASIAPSVEGAFFPPAVPGITDAFAPLDEAVGAVMSGQQTDIKAALDDAATRANAKLEENRQTYGTTPGGGTGAQGTPTP